MINVYRLHIRKAGGKYRGEVVHRSGLRLTESAFKLNIMLSAEDVLEEALNKLEERNVKVEQVVVEKPSKEYIIIVRR